MLSLVRLDVERYRGDFDRPPGRVALVLRSPGLQAVLAYRLERWRRSAPAASRPAVRAMAALACPLLRRVVRALYDIEIDASADIGGGLYIGHVGGIRIHACRIGRFCSIAQHTHVGARNPTLPGPTIGDRVWIGAHAEIPEGISIGAGATVAAGARVVRDVPSGALVAGAPARVIAVKYDNSPLIQGLPPEAA